MTAYSGAVSLRTFNDDPEGVLDSIAHDRVAWLTRHGRAVLLAFAAEDTRDARLIAHHAVAQGYGLPLSGADSTQLRPELAGSVVLLSEESFIAHAEQYVTELAEAGSYLLVIARGMDDGEQDGLAPFVALQAIKPGIEGLVLECNMASLGLSEATGPGISADELLADLDNPNACGGFPAAERPVGF